METHEGNSAPTVTKFHIESTWAPATPIKPPVTRPGPIYDHKGVDYLPPTYLREYSLQNQPQSLVSYSISSAEITSSNPNGINNYWDAQNKSSPSIGPTILGRENVGLQRRGLEDHLPHWSTHGPRSFGSASSGFSSRDMPVLKSGERENGGVVDSVYDESLAQFNNMSFGDLLAMKDSVMDSSMGGTRLGNNNGGVTTSALYPTLDPESQADGRGMETFCGHNLLSNGIRGGEMHNGAFCDQNGSLSNVNSPLGTKHANQKITAFAPLTPHLRCKAESNVASANINDEVNQSPNEQNRLSEDEDEAAMVNLQDVDNREAMGGGHPTPGKVPALVDENLNSEKVGEHGIDLNKMPQKKPRRKRYLPKVVNENKPKRTPKPSTPKPPDSKETPKPKRKYVRKNKMNPFSTATPAEGAAEVADPKPIEKALKSCKKSLNFDLNEHETDLNSVHMSNPGSCAQSKPEDKDITGNQPCNTMHPGLVEESTVQQMAKEVSRTVPDKSESFSGPNSSPCASSNEAEQIRGSKRGHSSITDATDSTAGNVAAYQSAFGHSSTVLLGNANIHGASGILFPGICKKKRTDNVQRSLALSAPAPAASDDINHASNTTSHSSNDASSLKYFYPNPVYFGGSAVAINRAAVLMRNVQSRMQLYNTWADLARLKKKKRSKGITRVRDLSELKGIASIAPATPAAKCPRGNKVDASGKPYSHGTSYINMSRSVHSCVEALTDDIHMTPRSKRGPRKQSSPRSFNKDKANRHWDLVLYDMKHPAKKNAGARSPGKMNVSRGSIRWISTCSVEAVTEGLKCLNINRECSEISRPEQSALVPYHVNDKAEKALVLYKQDGAIVPFEGPFEPIRKRRQRAKVELDDETTRVWRLLLENIDNQGIDGTDEEKVKWWENERSVFRGRVDSFIARMRLVQGDRRFTPWKGSVLDSVIGVFLTQNVSDHLSSSAFMALAAHFPVKSEHKESTLSEEAMSALVVEPEVFVIEPEESITWHDRVLDPPVCDQISRIVHDTDHSEEKEVVNSKELVGSATVSVIPSDDFCESSQKTTDDSRVDKPNSPTTGTEGASIIGDDRARDDETSSQQSVILSQNSVNSPNFQAIRIMSSFSDTNARAHDLASSSKCNYFDCSTSFMGLLKMAENPLLHESLSRIPGEDQQNCRAQASKDQSEAPSTSSSNYQLHRQIDFHSQASKYIEMLEAESRSSDTSRKDENSPIEQSNTESNGLHLEKEKALDGSPRSFYENLSSCYVLEGGKMVIQSQMQSMKGPLDKVASSAQGQTDSMLKRPNLPNLSQEPDVTESTTGFHTSNHQKEIDQVSTHNHISPRTLDKADPRPSKPKSRSGKEKRNAFDWDSLRRQAQPNGKKRERTSNTRDSIDWEAVRLAPVSEIADTIKARGMNNMLAERIKELLDRLLREHGSIDLEWLRDIPPDKAKEYLLSFRGLGLKSVECVRLLTLHHLAFPVDTNVGRIAVRLGWVPLQPLPESLQLHLLELYPVLESIQKYLWPRLCKLDQKTLYELHYHLITFGKVFCTKRQPNCNACPLRGECRHFASAFASARLALPGPDERSIMASNGGTSSNMHPLPNIDPLALPSIGENHQEGANPTCNINSSMIDVPPTPLSLPVPQTVNQFEKKLEINGCEPIVEVPASPEPEPEQEQTLCDIEDTLYEDPDDIPTITLNMKEFTQNLENFMQANSELQETGMSKALVALTSEAASIPMPKLKNISRLRTEHHVYELPDTHPLLKELDKREPDDPCSYLLAIWTPGETANSVEPPARKCSFEDPSILCNDATCSYCSSQRESNSQIVRATLLIPCRTAMRGSFPLNGTYFQVNEVFADHDSSIKPIEVPRSWLWNLPRRTVYFGTSIPTIFRGLNTEEIQHCFWRGYVCVRGFDQKTRAPRPLMARLHFPASKMQRGAKVKGYGDDE